MSTKRGRPPTPLIPGTLSPDGRWVMLRHDHDDKLKNICSCVKCGREKSNNRYRLASARRIRCWHCEPKSRSPAAQATIDRIVSLCREGLKYRVIARTVGKSVAYVQQVARHNGIRRYRERQKSGKTSCA